MVQFVGSSQLGYTSSQFGQTATQVTARRHVRLHLKRIRDREYCKLRELIPSVAAKKKVSKVQVIEEAVRYIEELHSTLMDRLRHKHGQFYSHCCSYFIFYRKVKSTLSNIG